MTSVRLRVEDFSPFGATAGEFLGMVGMKSSTLRRTEVRRSENEQRQRAMIESMTELDLHHLLEERGAILRGHFILTSGRHSDLYIEKFRILEQPDVLSEVCRRIADHFRGLGITLVAGPTTGGIIIAFEVARQLGVDAIYVETENGIRTLRRNAHVPAGSRVLVVDDVLTTGRSIHETIAALGEEGEVSGIGVLIDRSEASPFAEIPFFAACQVKATTFDKKDVPTWLAAIPAHKPGTRA